MKISIAIRLAGCAAALASMCAWGCEETLEACAPCGLVSDGATTISGDPRLDGVLEAVGRHAAWGARAEADYDARIDVLAHAVGYSHGEGEGGVLVATSADVEAISALVRSALFEQTGVATSVEIGMPRCTVDSALALERQNVCEKVAGCYVVASCDSLALGSCAGLCTGSCDAEVAGSDAGLSSSSGACFIDAADAGDSCLGECIGTCGLAEAGACAGRCRGACDGACTAYAADGECDGVCAGSCDGLCSSDLPMPCDGSCVGRCRAADGPLSECPGIYRGSCANGACEGACLGQFRPEGCDSPSACDGVLACQETGKDLAWAHMLCVSGTARVHVELGSAFTGDRARTVALATILEETLSALLRDYGQLSLLVDGIDPSGAARTADLSEPIDADARPFAVTDHEALVEAGVPDDRASLPLSALLARVSVLRDEVNGGGYKIAAGPMPCVAPAFEDAFALMGGLIPIAERDTSGSDPASWPAPVVDRTRGLYRVLDGAAVFLGLGDAAAK